jgi:hypothetical protein
MRENDTKGCGRNEVRNGIRRKKGKGKECECIYACPRYL